MGSADNTIELALKLLDCKHLYKFKTFIEAKRDIKIETSKVKRCRFSVSSKHLKSQLIKLGCTPQKSLTLKFPTKEQVPDDYIIPFIRGYYDGDGILTYSCSTTGRTVLATGMLGTENFLTGVLSKFKYPLHSILRLASLEGSSECKQVNWSKTDSEEFLNTIYKDATIFWIENIYDTNILKTMDLPSKKVIFWIMTEQYRKSLNNGLISILV